MSASRLPLDAAIEAYNRYRGAMATASLVARGDDGFRARFEGPFCTTCCRDDYFEDLVYELREQGVDPDRVAVAAVEQTGVETFVVEFAVD